MHADLWAICVNEYLPRNLRLRSQHTKDQYKFAYRNLAEYLGRGPTLRDLDDDIYAAWLKWLVEVKGLAEITANERAGRIKTLWTWLAKRGRIRCFPTIGRMEVPETPPLAWSESELQRIFVAAGLMPGSVSGIPAATWWPALLAWLWCTGERLGATLAMRWEHLDLIAGVAVLPASIRKQRRKAATYHLWPEVVAMLRTIRRTSDSPVFPWDRSYASYFLHYNKLLRLAKLPTGRRRKSQAMRVSHATWTQALGGDASKRLMHTDPATTRTHYLDKRFLPDDPVKLFRPWAG